MSFMGTLFVYRRSVDDPTAPEATYEFGAYESRGEWTVSLLGDELVDDGARPLLEEFCVWTKAPTLSVFVFEGDCGFVAATDPDGRFWTSCLVRNANVADVDEDELVRRYGSPEQSTQHAVAWSRAAGLQPDPEALTAVFAFEDEALNRDDDWDDDWDEESGEDDDMVFAGLALADRLFTALGLPAAES